MAMPKPTHVLAVVGVLLAVWVGIDPPAFVPAGSGPGIALAIATIALLATAVLPEYVTALLFFAVAMLFAIAPADIIFAGFHSTAFWMVFGGLVIGVGVRRTGLAERMAAVISRRFGNRYGAVIAGCVALGVALSFLMPSTMGRTLILMPIVLALSEALGYGEGSNGRTGMVLATGFGTMMPAFAILPATVPAMVLIGASETLYGVAPVYGSWLVLHFPVLGLLKALALVALVIWLFPERDGQPQDDAPAAQPMARDERMMTILLVLALAMWVTDFLHHISPAWIALGVAAICVLPFINIVPGQAFNERINYASLFYIACVLGLGALVAHSGAGDLMARGALQALDLQPGETAKTFAAVVGLSALTAMVLTQPGVPVVMTPLAGAIAEASGLPLESVLMMIIVGFSTVILPYQTPPLVIAMQLGKVPMSKGNRLCLALLAVNLLVLLPLDYLWWHWLGWFG